MKIELKHLIGYLPYRLPIKIKKEQQISRDEWEEIEYDVFLDGICLSGNLKKIKPILRPLSDLAKEIEINGEKFVPILEIYNILYKPSKSEKSKLKSVSSKDLDGKQSSKAILDFKGKYHSINLKHCDIKKCSYDVIEKLYEWHFDIHGIIEKGLAISIHNVE